MAKYISFGKYNPLFKYFWYHIIAKFLNAYILKELFRDKELIFKNDSLPPDLLIQEGFNYLGTFIISLFLIKYEYSQARVNDKPTESTQNIIGKNSKSIDITLIYHKTHGDLYKCYNLIVILLLILCELFIIIYFSLTLKGLDFWVLELFFICYITYRMHGIQISLHKQAAILFIFIFCSIFKILSLIFRITEDPVERIYTDYKWIIAIGILLFVLYDLLRGYTLCKIKSIIDYQFILTTKFLAIYGLFGSCICFLLGIIPTINACVDQNKFNLIENICSIEDKDNNKLYYDSYKFFFKLLWPKDNIFINILYVLIFIAKIILSFAVKFFCMQILKKLNPEYLISSNSLYYFIVDICDIILFLIKKDGFKLFKFFGTMAEFFSFLGTIIYLELIELHFCGLDHDLKKSITNRSASDSQMEVVEIEKDGQSELEETFY